jgi:hypothetical protein
MEKPHTGDTHISIICFMDELTIRLFAPKGYNIYYWLAEYFDVNERCIAVLSEGRYLTRSEIFGPKWNNKSFFLTKRLVGGMKKIKVFLPHYRSYDMEIDIEKHFAQVYNGVADRYFYPVRRIILKQNNRVIKPDDPIQGNYDDIYVEFLTGDDQEHNLNYIKEDPVKCSPKFSTLTFTYRNCERFVYIHSQAYVRDILLKFGLEEGIKDGFTQFELRQGGKVLGHQKQPLRNGNAAAGFTIEQVNHVPLTRTLHLFFLNRRGEDVKNQNNT